jgi:hypothetical protein
MINYPIIPACRINYSVGCKRLYVETASPEPLLFPLFVTM